MNESAFEVNFDGIVGPTHHFGGLSMGNLASTSHAEEMSNPKGAALQGLKKMAELMRMGVKQAVFPPQEKPDIATLRRIGFRGLDEDVIRDAAKTSPQLLSLCSSAASMWTANAATITPSADSIDRRVHLTPANLSHMFHRSLEHKSTKRAMQRIFSDPECFVVHETLPLGGHFADEGAANHTRFSPKYGVAGINLFVYGKCGFSQASGRDHGNGENGTRRYAPRQTLEASEAISRLHQIPADQLIFAQQNPEAIDAGVFHNDVISVGNQNLFFYHEKAFVNQDQVIASLCELYDRKCAGKLILVHVSDDEVPLNEVVETYLFNSQILTLPTGNMVLICPTECEVNPKTRAVIQRIIDDRSNPITAVHYFPLHESMKNGGGPACLRLRVVLNQKELHSIHPQVFLTDELYQTLVEWVERHYRERLYPSDLVDPHLLIETRTALDELTQILKIGQIYPFQRMEDAPFLMVE
jgi:succinylarginine dihydrolase